MILGSKRIIPRYCWVHKPDLYDRCKWTVAMILANSGVVPPK